MYKCLCVYCIVYCRQKQFPPKTYAQEVADEPSPFNDMFGTADDIFADVLAGSDK